MKKYYFILIFFLILPANSFSDNIWPNDVEVAIIKQDYSTAQTLSQELLAHNPDKATAYQLRYYRALSFLGQAKYPQAAEAFRELSQEKLDSRLHDKVFLGLFDSLYLMEQYKSALDVIGKLKKTSPKSEFLSLIYLKYARANLKLAKWSEAQEYLKRIVSDFPESMEKHTAKQLLEEKQFFAVQVGSFMDRARAEQLMSELKDNHEYSYIVEMMDHEGVKFYRVRVGQLSLLSEAKELQSKLSNQGYPAQIYP